MTAEQKELYEKFMDNRNEFDSLAEARVLEYDFKIVAKFVLEMWIG